MTCCEFTQDNTSVTVDVPAGDTHYSTVQLPFNGSIELLYVIGSNGGRGVVYISKTSENPNSALFDISAVISEVRYSLLLEDKRSFKSFLLLIFVKRKTYKGNDSVAHCQNCLTVVESVVFYCVACYHQQK